ncbi:MAG: hypothetical protein ABJC89_12525 [Acidobacteriota bacterium]
MLLPSGRAFRRSSCLTVFAILTCASISAGGLPGGPDSKSAASAKELTQLLDAGKLEAMAAADPSSPDTFVAALYIPGSQLLVISAKYTAPTLLLDKIKAGDFRGVYMDLHSASVKATRMFVQDQGADGLMVRASGDGADSFDEADKPHILDGAKKEKTSEAEYAKLYADADERYAKMLAVLVGQAKQPKPKPGS